MKIRVDTIMVMLATAIQSGSSALAYWLTARLETPTQFGITMSIVGICTTIVGVTDFGINNLTVREMSSSHQPVTVFRETLVSKLVLGALLCVAWALVTTGETITVHNSYVSLLYAPFLLATTIEATYQAGLRGIGRFGLFSVSIAVDKLVFLGAALVIGLIWHVPSLIFPVGMMLGAIAGLLSCMPLIRMARVPSLEGASVTAVVRLFRQSMRLGLVAMSHLAQRFDVPMVAVMAGSQAAGYYAAPARITGPLAIMPLSLGNVLFTRASKSSSIREGTRDLVKGMTMIVAIMVPIVILLYLFAPKLVEYILGGAYATSVGVFRTILVGFVFSAFMEPLATFLQGRKDERFVSNVLMIATILGLSVCAVGAKLGGASGAALGYTVRQSILFSLFVYRYAYLLKLENRVATNITKYTRRTHNISAGD